MPKGTARGLLLLPAALPAAFALWIILHFGVDFHTGDEWDPNVAGVYIKAYQHQLTFTDLAALHNEHRILVPRLLYLLLNFFTQWDSMTEQVVGWLVMLATSMGILWLMHKSEASSASMETAADLLPSPRVAGRWLVCNMLIFTPAQYENWHSGWCPTISLPGALVVAAIIVARNGARSWRQVGLCILLAAAASFCMGCGFVCWVVAGALLAWSNSWDQFRAKLPMLSAWIAALILCAALYFYHYHGPSGGPNAYEPSLYKTFYYIITFSGNAFNISTYPWHVICTVVGSVILALFVACFVYFCRAWASGRTELCGRMAVWFAVGGFSLANAILGGLNRGGYGLAQGVISRYVPFSIFLPLALVNLLPIICDDMIQRRQTPDAARLAQYPAFLAAAIVVAQLFGFPGQLEASEETQATHLMGKGALLLLNILPDNPYIPSMVHFYPAELIAEANAMNKMGYLQPPLIASNDASLIRQDDPLHATSVLGRIESVKANGPNQATVTGWAAFPIKGRYADAVFLTYQDINEHPIIFAFARTGLQRDDVAQSLHEPHYRLSGWAALVARDHLPSYFQSVVIKAWALDTDTGGATPLQGATTIGLR